MQKLSSTKVAEVLRQVGPTLRSQQAEIESLREKVAFYQRRERVEKIANQMQAKNLDPDSSMDEKVERLMAEDNLDVVEKAIDMSAQQVKLAALSDDPANATDAATAFEIAIVGE
jgi:hypothetical protein